jgi:hypothetical protein
MQTSSIFTNQPQDPKAFVFTKEQFGASPDGAGDNAGALQRAIDALVDTHEFGVLWIPEGEYRFADTVNVWRGVRLIGLGKNRPVFKLAANTPGYGFERSKYILHYRNFKPNEKMPMRDAQNTTFFSGLRNIDFALEAGNPGAVAVRFRVAQLSSVEDCVFTLADAKAGIEMIGNEVERCVFNGGQYGILTGETVPYWPFYLGDSAFSGQSRACISTYRAGMSLTRVCLSNAPYGIYVPNKERDNHYIEEFERLYMEDCFLENLSAAGICMNMVRYPQNWLHAERVYGQKTPTFFESFEYEFNRHIGVGPIRSESDFYEVSINMGLKIDIENDVAERGFDIQYTLKALDGLPGASAPDYVPMPCPSTWRSVKDFGAVGDGEHDDTEAIARAIAEAPAIYFPQGDYRLTRGIVLRPETAVLGLHCATTRFVLSDHEPAFDDANAPRTLLTIPKGGKNHVSGIGFNGGINPGLIIVEWLGEPESLMEDVFFSHGRYDVSLRGRAQYYGMWVHDQGAGVFKNIWMPDVLTRDGIHINDTQRPGKTYMLSIEHHLDIEVVMENVANWRMIALQTEENLGSEYASSIHMVDCYDVVFANLFQYRVQAIQKRHPYATLLDNCKNVQFLGVHVFSIGPCPFRYAAIVDGGYKVDDHEIGWMRVFS